MWGKCLDEKALLSNSFLSPHHFPSPRCMCSATPCWRELLSVWTSAPHRSQVLSRKSSLQGLVTDVEITVRPELASQFLSRIFKICGWKVSCILREEPDQDSQSLPQPMS